MNKILDANIHDKYRAAERVSNRNGSIKSNILVFVLVVFVAIAARQTFELGNMLSEAKALNMDISEIRAGQEVLLKQYASNNSNLSYYLNNG